MMKDSVTYQYHLRRIEYNEAFLEFGIRREEEDKILSFLLERVTCGGGKERTIGFV
jgi:hypothetical protein